MSNIILCADDSKTMQMVAEITFRVSDFEYVGASSADEALGKAREHKPALILADAIMPGNTGYDLCQAIKGDPELADIPVVVLCGNSAPYDTGKGAQAGVDAHLTKPWDTQVMLDKITELLDKFQSSGTAKRKAPAPGKPASPPRPPAPKLEVPRLPDLMAPAIAPKAPILPSSPPVPKVPAPPPARDSGRTHTLMGIQSSVLPPAKSGEGFSALSPPGESSRPRIPEIPAPPGMASKRPEPPRPPAAGPSSAAEARIPAPPAVPTAAPPSPKYAAPTKQAVITQPGVPEGPRPAPPKGVPTPPVRAQAPLPELELSLGGAPSADRVATQPAPMVDLGPSGNVGIDRPPMIRGVPTRRLNTAHRAAAPAPAMSSPGPRAANVAAANIAAATSSAAAHVARDAGLDPNGPEMRALLALSKDVVERVVWEVVPDLAEQIIRENLDQLTKR